MDILGFYTMSIFQDFESITRTEVDLVEDDNKLVLDEFNSSFVTYELQPGIYTFKDLSETFFNILQSDYPGPSNVIDIEFDDITRKSKLVEGPGIKAIRFHEKSFVSSILGFASGWEYKHYIEYLSQKNINLSSTNKILLKCNVIVGSMLDGLRQPIIFALFYKNLEDIKCFANLNHLIIKKINKSVLNTITFYLEDGYKEEVKFKGETLTFTLQMVKN